MAEFPALPLWTDRYLADTTHLADAEHGIYLLLLMHLWRTPRQRFPNDFTWIARKMGRSVEAFEKQVFPLMQEFMQCDGNWWTQKRLSMEWNYVKKTSEKRSEAAKLRWNNKNTQSQADALVCISPAGAPTPTPTPTPIEEERTYPSDTPPKAAERPPKKVIEANQPTDLHRAYYDTGISYLARFGKDETAARKLLGLWSRDLGGFGQASQALAQAQTIGSPDPVAYMQGACEKQKTNRNGNSHTKTGNGHTVVGHAVGSREWWEQVREMRGYPVTPADREKYEAKYGRA